MHGAHTSVVDGAASGSQIRPRPARSVRLGLCSLAAAALALATTARADVTQPDGTVVPVITDRLSGYLNGSANNDGIDEGIDVVHDAAVLPESFSPLCDFGGKYIAKGGTANFAVGWYNVDDSRADSMPPLYVPVDLGANLNTPAAGSDVQILFPFAATLPPPNQVTLTSVTIRQSPAYMGGLIGFVLVPNPNGTGSPNATEYHYTEHRFNVDCTLCDTPGPWYSDLTYRSNMLPDTFYLGFEDLDFVDAPGHQGINGNDLDYEDFLFRFSGLACPTAGQPCEVDGNVGACKAGVSDCDAQGNPICTAIVAPGSVTETCNGVDDDCNGTIDDGATCPGDQICFHGACVDPCGAGEFACSGGLVCDQGVCVEQACVGVSCPSGEVCHGGTCTAPCDGVVCPAGQVCRDDACVAPCSGVTCGMGEVCVSGVCVTSCACNGCPTGLGCDASGACVESDCVGVTCPAGQACDGGTCVDACANAVCPAGQTCRQGNCVAEMTSSSASSSGAGASSSSGPVFAGSGTSGAGGASGSAGSAAGGAGGAKDTGDFNADLGGCGCIEAGSDAPRGVGIVLAAALAAALGARRRRAR
jgi:hypothetical protein